MNFLKTLFWVVVAVSLAIFANRNWNDVTIDLWGNLQADVKLPVLLLLTFLIGFLPAVPDPARADLGVEAQAGAGRAARRDAPSRPRRLRRRRGSRGMSSPIFVAIDTPDMDRARAIAAAVKRHAGGLKLGPGILLPQRPRTACSSWPSSACRSSST